MKEYKTNLGSSLTPHFISSPISHLPGYLVSPPSRCPLPSSASLQALAALHAYEAYSQLSALSCSLALECSPSTIPLSAHPHLSQSSWAPGGPPTPLHLILQPAHLQPSPFPCTPFSFSHCHLFTYHVIHFMAYCLLLISCLLLPTKTEVS